MKRKYYEYEKEFKSYLTAKGYYPHVFASFSCSDKGCSCYIDTVPHLKDFTEVKRISKDKYYVRLGEYDYNNELITENLFDASLTL